MEFWVKTISRYNTPNDQSKNQHIKSISKELLFKASTDEFPIIPVVGDIIRYNFSNYKICNRIITLNSIIYEVSLYEETHLHSCGSMMWEENIPLVVDIP